MKLVKNETVEQEVEHLIAKALIEQDKAVKAEIKEVLNKKGYTFSSRKVFEAFIFKRVTIATVEDSPFLNLVFLDYKSHDDQGTFLFLYRNEIKHEIVDGVLKISIG
jgi:hypothetical protein